MSILIPDINSCIAFYNVMGGRMPAHDAFKFHWYMYNHAADPIPMSTPRAIDKVRRALRADQKPIIYPAPSIEEFALAMAGAGIDTTFANWGTRTPNIDGVIPFAGIMLSTHKMQNFLSVHLLEEGPYTFNWQVQHYVKGKLQTVDHTVSTVERLTVNVRLVEHLMRYLEITDIP